MPPHLCPNRLSFALRHIFPRFLAKAPSFRDDKIRQHVMYRNSTCSAVLFDSNLNYNSSLLLTSVTLATSWLMGKHHTLWTLPESKSMTYPINPCISTKGSLQTIQAALFCENTIKVWTNSRWKTSPMEGQLFCTVTGMDIFDSPSPMWHTLQHVLSPFCHAFTHISAIWNTAFCHMNREHKTCPIFFQTLHCQHLISSFKFCGRSRGSLLPVSHLSVSL